VRAVNDAPANPEGRYILYWMTGHRRLGWNYALDHAAARAVETGRPLVILEALRCDYPWVAARHHRFVMDGMREHRAAARGSAVAYYPYLEPEKGAGKGLVEALGADAVSVVTDDLPHFFYPRMIAAAGERLGVRLEAVDSCGLLPLAQPGREFTVAHSFRRHLHKHLLDHAFPFPHPGPLEGSWLPDASGLSREGGPLASVMERWPAAPDALLDGTGTGDLPIPGEVEPVPFAGGPVEAHARLDRFLAGKLGRYHEDRNDPDLEIGSRLSPYLHWGHLSPHEIFHRVVDPTDWTPNRVNDDRVGKREGWWGLPEAEEAFMDELLTWREIGFQEWYNGGPEVETFDTLPGWAVETLEEHASDPRPRLYDLDAFDAAETHDPLWNAAQRELRTEGTIHNYLRMLWGKKILEWSAHPREALDILLELNNRYAVDGRDPNSTSGIMWVLGRYDRGWPERAIYGKVRSMSSDSTRRKVSVKAYLRRFGRD
jgi:deoxyribodipyrimidine photo-lyase